MIQDAIKVEDVLDVSFETFAVDSVFITGLFKNRHLTASCILIELNGILDFFLFFVNDLKLSLDFGKPDKRLFLKFLDPFTSGLDSAKD